MKRIMHLILSSIMFLCLSLGPAPARADLWGGDVAVLLKILSNAIQQLVILKQTLDVARGDSELLRMVNRDIETALSEINAIQDIVRETNEIGQSRDPAEVLQRLRNIYGRLPRLGNLDKYAFADKTAGNAFGVDNDTHAHARQLDQVALRLQQQARTASPGRAQQISAQSQSIALHSLAQLERTNATLLRVTSTQLAMETEKQKNHVDSFDQSYSAFSRSKASQASDLTLGSL